MTKYLTKYQQTSQPQFGFQRHLWLPNQINFAPKRESQAIFLDNRLEGILYFQ